jgi:NNP family nitrate/nitrite transporter-like MFS transporter
MVATPILAGAALRIVLGFAVDRFGGKQTGIVAQSIVAIGLLAAWSFGLPSFQATLFMGIILGFAGASFAVALPQAGRWYPPHMQGLIMGLAGAGNVGVVIDSFFAPRVAAIWGWQATFGIVLIPVLIVLAVYIWLAKDAPVEVKARKLADYFNLLKQQDAHWFCLYYTVSFGGFVGLGTSLVIYFTTQYGITPVDAGGYAALCTLAGALLRPVGGAIADHLGGVRSLTIFYTGAAVALVGAAFVTTSLMANFLFIVVASGFFGMANGSVFQLLPQRFAREIGIMTGLVGCGGGVGGFLLATMLGYSKGWSGSYTIGILIFAGLCVVALSGLHLVKTRWRSTWGALSGARI